MDFSYSLKYIRNLLQFFLVFRHREEVLRPEDDHPNFVDAFLAYTPPGEVQGDLVYVNYGREEDLDIVEGFGIDLIVS